MDGGHGPVLLVDEEDRQAVGRADGEDEPRDVRHQGVALGLAGGGRVQPVNDVRMELAHDDGRHAFRRGEAQEVRLAPAGVAEAVDEAGDGHEARHGEEGALAFEHGAPLIPESRGPLKASPMYLNQDPPPAAACHLRRLFV